MSKNFKFLQPFVRLNELVSQNERKTQQIFLPKSNQYANTSTRKLPLYIELNAIVISFVLYGISKPMYLYEPPVDV